MPPGRASGKRIVNSCGVPLCGTDSEQTYARQTELCGGKSALHSALLPRVARELIPLPLRGAILWRSQEVGRVCRGVRFLRD